MKEVDSKDTKAKSINQSQGEDGSKEGSSAVNSVEHVKVYLEKSSPHHVK